LHRLIAPASAGAFAYLVRFFRKKTDAVRLPERRLGLVEAIGHAAVGAKRERSAKVAAGGITAGMIE
jgi:hypothetical protein